MRVLITGISGFVGRHLCAACLQNGDHVSGLSRYAEASATTGSPVIYRADLTDRDATRAALEASQPDVIYHLAAQSNVPEAWKDPAGTITNNVAAEANLLQSLVDLGASPIVVAVGSSECYGRIDAADLPVRESVPMRPVNPYGVSKAAQDLIGFQYFASHGLPVIRMRPFNHIGPGQSDRFVVPSFARQIAEIERGMHPSFVRVGNLSAIRDFTDVRDVVRGYRLAAKAAKPGAAYNMGTGNGVSIAEVLDLLIETAGTSIEVRFDPERSRPIDQPRLICDSTKFRAATGWQPNVPLRESLVAVLEWSRRGAALNG